MNDNKICLITFSNNVDHQNVVYSMYDALKLKADVYTIGISNPKSIRNVDKERNFYFDCPLRPGIEKQTFRIDILIKMANLIRKKSIKYLYFESMHIWNPLLMILCPQCKKIVAVHDVIPHDGNKAMDLANFVTCKMSHHILLRNYMYKDTLVKRLHVKPEKITCFELWRYYPEEKPITGSGIFLCFGRIRKYKGFDLLIDIVKKCPNVTFRVVGAPDEESMVYVNELKKMNNVQMIPYEVTESEMERHFYEADWLVLPYSAATQSGVIVDACRLSRPVIAFNVGAISEQILDGETGFLVEEKNTEQFAKIVNRVCQFELQATQKMASKAYMYGYNKYAAEAVADRFLNTIYSCEKKGANNNAKKA